MVRMGPPGGGGTSDDSSSNDSDSGSSSSDSGSSSGSSSGGSSTGSSGYGGGGLPDDVGDPDEPTTGSSGSGGSSGGGSSDSGSVGSPGPRERREARQDAQEQIEDNEPERTVGSPGPRERRRVRNQDDETTEQIERNIEEQTGREAESGEDFTTTTRTYGGFSPSAQQRQRARQIRESEGQEEATDYLERNTQERTVTSVNFTDSFLRELSTDESQQTTEETQQTQQPGRRDSDIFSGLVSGTEDALSEVAQTASGDESTRVEFRGEGSVVNVAAQEDTDLTADLGPVSDVGDAATEIGQRWHEDYIQPTAQTAGDIADVSQSGFRMAAAGNPANLLTQAQGGETGGGIEAVEEESESATDRVADVGRGEEQDVTADRTFSRFTQGTVEGGLGIANAPAVAGTVVDAGEFTAEGASRTAEGEGGEFAQQAGGQAALAGARATEYAAENPTRTTGMVAGGLVTSSAAIRGAQAAGGARAGRATSFAIQPGEELALTAARRGVPGAQRAASAVSDIEVEGGNRQGLFSDERGTGQPPSLRLRRSGSDSDTQPEISAEDLNVPRGQGPSVRSGGGGSRSGRSGSSGSFTGSSGRSGARGSGSRTGRTSSDPRLQRSQERREQAEQSQVTEGDAEFGTETDAKIAESVLRAESTAEGVQERTTQAQEQELTQAQELTPDVGEVSISDVAVETDTESRTDTRQEVGQEPRQETRQETRTETRAEVRTEPRQETRTELRTELGLETRSEARSETEIDPELEEEENGIGTGRWRVSDDQFSTGIADVDDLTENGFTDDAEF